ncbi:pseudouridine synthase [Coniophora puteana RWD-64-598 SS2]|uniref:Pseudouridine synthase n=1 Tax=Coniophora puteana (strain RWD-64-598) TaxID=741705 RepID=A0A5M3MJD2_CONPW|nr:pseudouridine synthase [Coniophora puteana RWD-64-598 SS2]EIW79322.1 pseudouridine synthase [Coniophora puteana RWD-64-598 SS2]
MSEAGPSFPVTGQKRSADEALPVVEGEATQKRVHVETAEAETRPSGVLPLGHQDEPVGDVGGSNDKQGKDEKRKSHQRRDASGFASGRKNRAKDTKRVGRRRGSRPDGEDQNGVEAGEQGGEGEAKDKAPRLPKRMTALLLGFCGRGFNGMQIQPDVRTIEGVLFDALVRVGAVSQDNADDPVKVSLGRAARTDAGVHAAGNLVSMKLITAIPGVPDFIERLNTELPPEIRVWSEVRVQNSFNARTACDSRKYTYLFPSYLLVPPKPGSGLHAVLDAHAKSTSETITLPEPDFWASPADVASGAGEDLVRKRQYRASPTAINRLREAARAFEGTHNFHNFTVGRIFSERASQRHMKCIEVGDPEIHGGTEWISVMFHGQSFMLHQVRKMMSALVLSSRIGTPARVIDEMYGPRVVFVPKMPALGLLLEYPIFDSYNARIQGANFKASLSPDDPDFRAQIDFEKHRSDIDAFKQRFIYDAMREVEDREGIFDAWIRSVDSYTGEDLLWLNAKGTIPANAVRKLGERRQNAFQERKLFDRTSFSKAGRDGDLSDEEEEGKIQKKHLEDMEG